jgi:hypothetical protein
MQRVGLHRLAGKKLFYIGLASGAAAIAGGLALARLSRTDRGKPLARLRQLYRRLAPARGQAPLVNLREVPEMSARQALTPTPRDKVTGKCADCGSSPQSKPGAWYVIDGKAYCQDCAPQGAREAGKGLQSPAAPTPAIPSVPPGGVGLPAKVATPAPKAVPLDPAGRQRTTLQRRAVAIRSLDRESGQVGETRVDGYEVLAERPPSAGRAGYIRAATGMAIAPAEGGWTITHLATGQKIAGPYESPAEAQQLAAVLAQLDWTPQDPVSRFSNEQRAQVAATIRFYDEALREARAQLEREIQPERDAPVADDDEPGDSLEEELLFSEVERIGHAHGFQRGYHAGAEAALKELGREPPGDPDELDAELTEKEAADLDRLQQAVSPLEFDDTYSVIYQESVEEGYDDGYEAGYLAVMSQSQRDAGLSRGDAGLSHEDAGPFGPNEGP